MTALEPDDAAPSAEDAAAPNDGPGPRIVVVRGGEPTAEQAAALSAAIVALSSDEPPHVAGPSGWQRAALLEGVGHRRLAQRSDLEVPGYPR